MANTSIISWNTPPDFDKWGWDTFWGCMEWQDWYDALKAHFGKESARKIWLYAWNKQGFAAHALDCRFNGDFRDFAKKEGLDIHGPISAVLTGVTDVLGTAGETVKVSVNILRWLIPILLVLLIIGVVFVIGRAVAQNKLPFGVKIA